MKAEVIWAKREGDMQWPLIQIIDDDGESACIGDYQRAVKMLNELLPKADT